MGAVKAHRRRFGIIDGVFRENSLNPNRPLGCGDIEAYA
jgi:hypothetical protein